MSEVNENFNNVKLEDVALMIADGFSDMNERMATKENLETLRKEMHERFEDVERKLGVHVTDVREQTDSLAYRTKKLEETVYGVGESELKI